MSKVLVVGGAGYIGSHTVHQLCQNGFQVVVVDDLSTGVRAAIPEQAELFEADILDLPKLRTLFLKHQFDAIFHFAAKLSVPESFLKFDEYVRTNVLGTFHLLQMCREFQIEKFIFSSTAAVYGDVQTGFVSEEHPLRPQNPYGQTKQMAEQLIQSYATTNPSFHFHILRYFNVSGAEADGSNGPRNTQSGQLIMNLCQSALTDKLISVFGHQYNTPDGTAIRDYIHVVDLAHAHLEAFYHLKRSHTSGVWNCGYGKGYSVLEMIKAFERANNIQFQVAFKPPRQGDPARVIASNSRMIQESSWVPKHNDVDKICKSTFDWIRREQ